MCNACARRGLENSHRQAVQASMHAPLHVHRAICARVLRARAAHDSRSRRSRGATCWHHDISFLNLRTHTDQAIRGCFPYASSMHAHTCRLRARAPGTPCGPVIPRDTWQTGGQQLPPQPTPPPRSFVALHFIYSCGCSCGQPRGVSGAATGALLGLSRSRPDIPFRAPSAQAACGRFAAPGRALAARGRAMIRGGGGATEQPHAGSPRVRHARACPRSCVRPAADRGRAPAGRDRRVGAPHRRLLLTSRIAPSSWSPPPAVLATHSPARSSVPRRNTKLVSPCSSTSCRSTSSGVGCPWPRSLHSAIVS